MATEVWSNGNQGMQNTSGAGLTQEEMKQLKADIKKEVLEEVDVSLSEEDKKALEDARNLKTDIDNVKEEIDEIVKAGDN